MPPAPSLPHRGPSQSQRSLYWRTWATVVRAHGWRGDSAILQATREDCWASPALNRVYQAIWQAAGHLAAPPHNERLIDALRHACHFVAADRLAGSRQLTNAELDRVLDLFRLLAEPDNLDNVAAWLDAEAGERRRHVHVITQSPAAYWQSIARDKFRGETDLDRLTLTQLRQLTLTLRKRANAFASCAKVAPSVECNFTVEAQDG